VRQATGDVEAHVGTEIDITIRNSFWQGRFSVAGGYGHLFAGAYVSGTGPSADADFFYLQTKISK
jgi:hypothetical protein